ncbi:probable prolyl 4-hydroxylase 12 [Ricinus communis]|uniref:procollagen-proline 4-dioxygenase n=1 Tax=Ricinus communis TaxID=3988 RepID=B9RIW8_RICCO|nr:probable prolyl 4-hydroxylase 12 [Ricinus communis]EEF49090.1 prolyl 4-hydroxylase alpha subunit, putative [Ricinus communis]|eukprot:XP_002513687.1 probable prolyl 4-hydroxylase 12 [Ricinus communis]
MASLYYFLLLVVLIASAPFHFCFAESIRKELRDKEVKHETIIQLGSSVQTNRISLLQVVQLSWRPRVFLYKGFLTDEECDRLISLAHGAKEISKGKGDGSRNNIQLASSESRSHIYDDLLARIEERISAWTFIPKENSKPLQVMHYGIEEAREHFDYFDNKTLISNVSLMATLVLYLSNVTRGGEILFPKSELKDKVWSDCTKDSSILRPVKGNAVLIFNAHLNASADSRSTHGRCPVLEGEMWCATKQFLVRATNEEKSLPDSDGSDCTDEDDNCPKWAALGECQRNPIFMTGSPDYYGTCRKSCNAC